MSVHPATYSRELLPVMARMLADAGAGGGGILLDPFGGTGHGLAALARILGMLPVAIEIKALEYREAGVAHWCVLHGDALNLDWPAGSVAAAVTSPVYPNGMADSFRARDASVRHTYQHSLEAALGRPVRRHPNDTSMTNPRRSPAALAAFMEMHLRAWAEVYRALCPGAPFLVNTKDVVRRGQVLPFTDMVRGQLLQVGFQVVEVEQVACPGNRHGANGAARVEHEDLTLVVRPKG